MAEKESRYKAYEVVNFLCGLLRKAGPVQIKLPGESSLARQFSVSRGTIQRAMEGIISRELVVKIPGKQGYYSNPDLFFLVPRCVGVLVNDGKEVLTTPEGVILGDFVKEMIRDRKEEYYFHHLRREDLGVLESSLVSCGIDSLLWISPPQEYFPRLEALVRNGFPAVSIHCYYNSSNPYPESNSIIPTGGKLIRDLLLEKLFPSAWKEMVYCGYRGDFFQHFRKELEEKGGCLAEENIIEEPSLIEEKLKMLLRKKKISAIFTDGGHERYRPIVTVLNSRKEYRKIPIYLFKNSMAETFAARYPCLDFQFFENGSVTNLIYHKAGKAAACALREMEEKNLSSFPNLVLEPDDFLNKQR